MTYVTNITIIVSTVRRNIFPSQSVHKITCPRQFFPPRKNSRPVPIMNKLLPRHIWDNFLQQQRTTIVIKLHQPCSAMCRYGNRSQRKDLKNVLSWRGVVFFRPVTRSRALFRRLALEPPFLGRKCCPLPTPPRTSRRWRRRKCLVRIGARDPTFLDRAKTSTNKTNENKTQLTFK